MSAKIQSLEKRLHQIDFSEVLETCIKEYNEIQSDMNSDLKERMKEIEKKISGLCAINFMLKNIACPSNLLPRTEVKGLAEKTRYSVSNYFNLPNQKPESFFNQTDVLSKQINKKYQTQVQFLKENSVNKILGAKVQNIKLCNSGLHCAAFLLNTALAYPSSIYIGKKLINQSIEQGKINFDDFLDRDKVYPPYMQVDSVEPDWNAIQLCHPKFNASIINKLNRDGDGNFPFAKRFSDFGQPFGGIIKCDSTQSFGNEKNAKETFAFIIYKENDCIFFSPQKIKNLSGSSFAFAWRFKSLENLEQCINLAIPLYAKAVNMYPITFNNLPDPLPYLIAIQDIENPIEVKVQAFKEILSLGGNYTEAMCEAYDALNDKEEVFRIHFRHRLWERCDMQEDAAITFRKNPKNPEVLNALNDYIDGWRRPTPQ